MGKVSAQQLQQESSQLLDRVEAGESFVVSRNGRLVAELRPLTQARAGERPYGLCAGDFDVPDDFDEPLPHDTLQRFQG